MTNIFAMILAGGKGERLSPLTEQRAKPAGPFGGKYRIIDFALSNCLNSGLRKIAVLIQYKSHSLSTFANTASRRHRRGATRSSSPVQRNSRWASGRSARASCCPPRGWRSSPKTISTPSRPAPAASGRPSAARPPTRCCAISPRCASVTRWCTSSTAWAATSAWRISTWARA